MRTTAGLLLVGALAMAGAGCASDRGGLAKSEPPKSKAATTDSDTRVTYGNPWAKPSGPIPERPAGKSDSATRELEAQLAEARARQAARKTEIADNLRLGAEAEQRGDLAAAKLSYQKVVEADPRNGEAHHRLAVIADQQQDPRTADTHYTQALAANRRDADLLSDIGYSHFLRGNLDESERYLREALDVNNFHRMAAAHLAQVYVRQGKYDAALAMFRQVSTENEAQRQIAQAFPNGRPGGGTMPFAHDRNPAPTSNDFANARNAGLAAGTVPPVSTAAAAAPSSATLQQLVGELHPSVPTVGVFPATAGQAPLTPGTPSATPGNLSAFPTTTPGAQPAPVASQNAQPLWGGNMGQNTAPPPASSVPPATLYDVSRVPAPAAPLPPANSNWNAPPASSTGAAGFGPEFQSNGFDNRAGANPIAWPTNPGTAASELSSPDAARWAAHLAMNSGPGVMFPVVAAGTTNPTSSIMQAGATGTPQNEVHWAYGETSPSASNQVQHAVNWSDRATNGGEVQSSAWNSAAPPSPWNDWQSPAPPSRNWMTPPEFAAPPSNQPPTTNPNGASNLPPQWSAATNTAAPPAVFGTPSRTTSPADYPSSTVMQLNNSVPAQSTAVTPAPPATFGPPAGNAMPAPTTISNWPYAPTRQ